ncbi:MAG: EamA family transporter RarD [Desulfofustis sp.]|nr:EamA family transporter RarD [Desulfofustis sp.]
MSSQLHRGMVAASVSYVIWGVLPIYWKSLDHVPSYEILGHRMAWSLPFIVLFLVLSGQNKALLQLRNRRTLGISAGSAALLSVNWFIYIWAVNAGYIVETSLGYYINPLVTVGFGVVFLQERLRGGQIAALGLAFCGVVYLTLVYGNFPWIALALAATFAVYGLIHKKIRVGPMKSLYLETIIFFLPALVLVFFLGRDGSSGFLHGDMRTMVLLAGTGLVTTVPLLLFGYAAQKIPMFWLGILQYTAPTLNLLIGVLVYGEEFPFNRLIGFLLVWSALVVLMAEGIVQRARQQRSIAVGRN